MTQGEALRIAMVSLGIRAGEISQAPNYRAAGRLWKAVRVLERIEALYDPDSDAWTLR